MEARHQHLRKIRPISQKYTEYIFIYFLNVRLPEYIANKSCCWAGLNIYKVTLCNVIKNTKIG